MAPVRSRITLAVPGTPVDVTGRQLGQAEIFGTGNLWFRQQRQGTSTCFLRANPATGAVVSLTPAPKHNSTNDQSQQNHRRQVPHHPAPEDTMAGVLDALGVLGQTRQT